MNAVNAPVCIAADHPALPGHFPGRPIVPAAVLLDEVLYAIGCGQPAGWRVDAVKFHRPVSAGLALQLQCQRSNGGRYVFELQAGGERYVSGTVSIAAGSDDR